MLASWPAVYTSNSLGQHLQCTSACAYISLFGSHNYPKSRQGKDGGRIIVLTDEETELREVKLLSQVMHVIGNRTRSPAWFFVAFLLHQPGSDDFVFKQIKIYLVILSRTLNQAPTTDCEGLS